MPKTTPSLGRSSGWRIIWTLKWSLKESKHLTNINSWHWPVAGQLKDICLLNPCRRRVLASSSSATVETLIKPKTLAWHARREGFDTAGRDTVLKYSCSHSTEGPSIESRTSAYQVASGMGLGLRGYFVQSCDASSSVPRDSKLRIIASMVPPGRRIGSAEHPRTLRPPRKPG